MKNYLIILAFTCLAAPLFAQFSLGLSAGVNQTYWKWSIKSLGFDIDFEAAIGYRAAVFGEWQISPLIGLRAEAATQQKSNKLSDLHFEDGLSKAKYRENYQYWEGSLLCQVSPIKRLRHVYLLAGGTMGRLTKGWTTIKGSGPEFENNRESKRDIDIETLNHNRTCIAADFGLGGNIPLGHHSSIKIEGRYQYSLTNFSANNNVDAKSSPLIFTVGYLHRL